MAPEENVQNSSVQQISSPAPVQTTSLNIQKSPPPAPVSIQPIIEPKKSKWWIWLMIILGIIIVAGGIYYFFFM